MIRSWCALALLAGLISSLLFPLGTTSAEAGEVRGHYLEARTCQVYTGPCFANAEMALAGKSALLAWKINEGRHAGVDLAGLSVVVAVSGSDTLGFDGLDDAKELKSVVLVDRKATPEQASALVDFAKKHAGKAGKTVVRVDQAPIEMSLDTAELNGELTVGKTAKLVTRRAKPGDCICANETAFYPPLAKVENFAPGVTVDGHFSGRGLGDQWSIPDSRSAYMATFAY
ncbi:MAG: DUF1326 domain-containing protein [Pirellulales bacterium]